MQVALPLLMRMALVLDEFEHNFRYVKDLRHKLLLFLVHRSNVSDIIDSIKSRLHLNYKSKQMHGLVFSLPIENLQGLSLRQRHLYQKLARKSSKLA